MYIDRNNYKKTQGEINNGKILVETAGYLPAEKIIQNLMLAGQRLAAYRAEQYDYPDGKIDINARPDPTRHRDFDIAEASMLQKELTDRLEMQAEAAEAAKKASQNAQDQRRDDPEEKPDESAQENKSPV